MFGDRTSLSTRDMCIFCLCFDIGKLFPLFCTIGLQCIPLRGNGTPALCVVLLFDVNNENDFLFIVSFA